MKREEIFQLNEDKDPTLKYLKGFAWATLLLSLFLFLSLSASRAQEPNTPPPGFRKGPRSFQNPFANSAPGTPGTPGAPAGTAITDDEDNEDEVPSRSVPSSAPRISISKPGQTPVDDVPAPKLGAAGLEIGGEAPGGVIAEKAFEPLTIDSETGSGSAAVITDFNFPDADIIDIAKTLGKLTGKNFVYDKTVKGRVTIVANSPITVGDAWRAFLTALDINGFALVPSGKFIRITRQRDARDKQVNTYTGESSPNTDALITRVFPLKYIGAEEVARTFRSFMPANSRIIPHEQTNTVIVTDTGTNISKLAKMLEFLDIEGYDAGIEVINVKFASASELAKLIDQLLPGTQTRTGAGQPRFSSAGRSGFASRKTKEGGIINTIIADERTNTLIVHANQKGADQVRELVAKLDRKIPATIGGGKIHVIYLQFADAEKVSETINKLSSDAGGATRSPRSGASGSTTGSNPVQSGLFEGTLRVAADKATNSLVVTASPADFVTVQRVIAKLDIPRDQVYVEMVIMEMNLENNFAFSANAAFPRLGLGSLPKGSDLVDFISSPLAQKGMVLGFQNGSSVSIPVGGQNVTVKSVTGLVKALQTNSKADVLATPQILTLDNTEAEFESAERIPVLTSTSSQGTISQSTTKENVGLKIKIKPFINKAADFVKLDITATLEDISNRELPGQVAQLALATLSRTAKTTVIVGNSDTVVLGGLIRDKVDNVESKIPLLGDIPLLGWLFKSKSSTVSKSNLLIFMTPHIVKQYEKVRAILDKKLRERDDFIEAQGGGNDPLRSYRDKLIKDLPDIKTIGANKYSPNPTLDDDSDEEKEAVEKPLVDPMAPSSDAPLVDPLAPLTAEPEPSQE